MNTLVVYYSRTGRTKKLAEDIKNSLTCDIEEIFDTVKRSGPFGYLRSGRQAMKETLTVLKDSKRDLSLYDLIIIGTPVWANSLSAPVRTYLHQNKDHLNKVAFFCSYGGSGFENTFSQMEELCKKKPVGVLAVEAMDVLKENYADKVKKFVGDIQK